MMSQPHASWAGSAVACSPEPKAGATCDGLTGSLFVEGTAVLQVTSRLVLDTAPSRIPSLIQASALATVAVSVREWQKLSLFRQ